MRRFSLRHILAASLVLLAVVPALLAVWLMGRSATHAVEDLAGKVLTQVASQVQTGTEAHLRQAHDVLDGLLSERPSAAEVEHARAWLRAPALVEGMAFALTRQSSAVPLVHVGNLRGEYLGLETTAQGTKVSVRGASGGGRTVYLAARPGDRSRLLQAERSSFEPRGTSWYGAAVREKGRVFSRVQVHADRRSLAATLSQPVYDADGGVAGVVAAELYLHELDGLLRTQRISGRGAAFVVDEKGALVASSAGDPLVETVGGRAERRSPRDSANPAIRTAFAALEQLWATRSADTVATDTSLRRLGHGKESLLMVQRPFGQALGLQWTLVVAAPETDFTAEIDQARRLTLVALAALLLLGTLVAASLAHGIGRQLRRLSLAAQQLGRGEVPQGAPRTRIREVHELSCVLHDSARQLAAYRDQVRADAQALQEANQTLEARVAQRTSQLAASREEALAASRAKAAFLATMSHEIRTPLNGVVGMSTLLMETALDAEQRDYLETIRLSSDQLLAVINDILDFSKIESGKLELEREPLSVRSAVEEACDIAAPRAREKGIELIVDVPETGPDAVPPGVLGDITRLRQVLINLVNNAVKFTAEGEVAVQARLRSADDGHGRCVVEFRVTDSGIGIPLERQGSLFEAFSQVDASTTRKYGGTGLGLAICKRLVELMDGSIGVESAPGRGSTFWFTVAAPPATLERPLAPTEGARLQGRRVLVVDDHATNVRILVRQLQLWGMEVDGHAGAAEALAALEQAGAAPDLVITDMHMPGMDGVAFARALRAAPAWRELPVVLLSSGFMPGGDESARLFQARLLKPARQSQLFETLLRCLVPDAAAPAAATASDRKGRSVLVADDNAVNLKVACAMLIKLGYETATAADGAQAVDAVQRAIGDGRPFAAVLMDVHMPDVDGLQATRQIQAAWGKAAPPIIALTAGASADDRARCEAAGMQDYLTKPLQVAALAQALERWTGGQDLAVTPSALPADTPREPELVDFGRLREFKEYDDEALTMTREVIALFVADAPARLQAAQAATAAGDAAALARAAHALKGAATNVGALALGAACADLEAAAGTGLPADLPQRLVRLDHLWRATRDRLLQWMSSAGAAGVQ